MTDSGNQPRRVAVVGPTASGKTSVALAAAEQVGDTEIVSVDSMQVYRGMDIGTAKPTPAEQRRVRHHLIDLVEPTDEFTVAEFQSRYRAVLTELASRHQKAILVGGTGLYHRAVIDDLDLPGEWPAVRERLDRECATRGLASLYTRLAEVDPDAAEKIEPSNRRRILRALEVCEGSGKRFSSFGPGLDTYPASPVPQIGLRWDRAVLARRVADRVAEMLERGLLDEVRALRDGGLSRTAAQALGYKELLAYLNGEVGWDAAVQQIITRTRQFAVRQERWFRRDPRVQWVDITSDPVAEVMPVIERELDGFGRDDSPAPWPTHREETYTDEATGSA